MNGTTPLRVLLVENSEDDELLIEDCLREFGYQPQWRRVETAADMRSALREPWEIILSDYTMPGFGGMEALAIYKNSGLDIPFFLVSGSIGEERAVEAMRSGVHDYIMKDRMQRLGPAVERELREAANRRERRATIEENLRLNGILLELNEALREKVELLSRSHADLEQVTWAASHDLKEPLRIVTTYSQLLLRRRAPAEYEEMEFARYITEGVERVSALIDGLLSYANNLRQTADPLADTDADAAAQEAIRQLADVIEERAAFVVVDPLPRVKIEPQALVDIFYQLLSNALEYRRAGVQPRIHIQANRSGSGAQETVRFAIRDNGLGIKPEHHAQIFQLFRRLHGAEYSGIGVGLPLCKRLIENYGGRLWLESEPGVGSTFYFTLNAASRAANAAAK